MTSPDLADAIDLSRVRRVLVIKLRHHGDVLLTSPVFTALQRAAPHAEIDALVYRETAPMLAGHPAIAVVHTIDRGGRARGVGAQIAGEWRLWRALVARRFDLVVHLTDHLRGAWLSRLVGARYAVAPERARAGRFWRACFSHRYLLPRARPRHTVEANLDALRRIGVWPADADKALVLTPGADAEARVAALLDRHALARGRFIVVHPGSRWRFKCWPAAHTAALLDRLAADGWPLVVTGAPDPDELALVRDIIARTRAAPVVTAGELTLAELGAFIAAARLFVGCDTAPMHMAAATGTPVVVTFGPSGEAEWGPWRVPHRVVASSAHVCRPCGNAGCGGGKISDCLLTLPVEHVTRAVHDLLAETGALAPS
jgi:heptosyltransferase-3